jgi:hypothetical protein
MKNYHLDGEDGDGRIILKWILRKYVLVMWSGLNCLMIGPSGRWSDLVLAVLMN